MRKYFGTDGIRSIANTELTPELVYRVAKAGAYVLAKNSNHIPTILIGRDTRISGKLIEAAMCAGFLSYGANVKLLGVMPTPAVAYLTKKLNADASVVISASHNSYEFNGIKFFSNLGMKLADEIEEEIEEIMDNPEKMAELSAKDDKIGVYENSEDLLEEYIDLLERNFGDSIKKYSNESFKVALDAAHGATYEVAEKVFSRLGINYTIINNAPDGININDNCGSTHMEELREHVMKNNMSLGIAYDGDGDRCLAIDEKGNDIDGDQMIAVFAKYLSEKGKLAQDTLVTTVMSNMGLNKFANQNNLTLKQTKVGDRYVLEEMLKGGYSIGGEQSGHVIMQEYNPTGDGILTSLMLIQIMLEKNIPVSELCDIITIFPQTLVNVRISNSKKSELNSNEKITAAAKALSEELGDSGRLLLRPSGTEPLVRVMIEGEDAEDIEKKAKEMAALIEEELK
ncbi:MAG: phosphoglucosamine mutase [Oscillospiraceae bacterium]|nr:phosphoglucosamine mutase [Oscillospiraceae bacterium]